MPLFVYRNNEQFGPYPDEQVAAGLRDGTFLPYDLGCREGNTEWQSLSTLFPLDVPASQTAVQPVTVVKYPKCTVGGYAGPMKNQPMIYPRDLVISIVLFCLFGAGLIWFTISLLQKKPKSCPNCKSAGMFTYVY
jgi:hypothetical protein